MGQLSDGRFIQGNEEVNNEITEIDSRDREGR